jgi:hypothetical protein
VKNVILQRHKAELFKKMSSLGITVEEVISTVLADGKRVASTTDSPEEDLLLQLVENYLK